MGLKRVYCSMTTWNQSNKKIQGGSYIRKESKADHQELKFLQSLDNNFDHLYKEYR